MNLPECMIDVLLERCRSTPGKIGVRLIKDVEGGSESFSYNDLFSLARQAQPALKARGVRPGGRILILLPTGESYLAAVLGAMLEGAIPVSLGIPLGARSLDTFFDELGHYLKTIAPALLIVDEEVEIAMRDRLALLPPLLTGQEILRTQSEAGMSVAGRGRFGQISHIQLSSGSTGRPKGVVLSHRGLISNLEGMRKRLQLTPDHIGLSWLPMFHDMGFVGSLLLPMYAGFQVNLMDPSLFVSNPIVWLKLISRFKVTVTPGPPSALAASLRLLERRGGIALDMGSWEIAAIGSETIPARLVDEFTRVLSPFGARPHTLRPVYGLAEASLAVTMPLAGTPPRVDWIDASTMERTGEAVAVSAENPVSHGWVSSGTPLAGTTLQILGDDGEELPERRAGRIVVCSPSLMLGSFQDGKLTPHDGTPFDTGDVGYLADGELFITGRRRDVIIKRGRNFSPDRLEELASSVSGVLARRVAAFGVWDEDAMTEQVIVMAETSLRKTEGQATFDLLRLSIKGKLQQAGYDVDEVVLLPKGALPRTTSGKIRRHSCRELYATNLESGSR